MRLGVETDAEKKVQVTLQLLVRLQAPRTVSDPFIHGLESQLEDGTVDFVANLAVCVGDTQTYKYKVLLFGRCSLA